MMDNFPEELNEVVYTDHWKLFPPQHPLIVDFFGLLFFFLWCISFFGNGIVIIIFLITKNLRTPVSLNLYYRICKGQFVRKILTQSVILLFFRPIYL